MKFLTYVLTYAYECADLQMFLINWLDTVGGIWSQNALWVNSVGWVAAQSGPAPSPCSSAQYSINMALIKTY